MSVKNCVEINFSRILGWFVEDAKTRIHDIGSMLRSYFGHTAMEPYLHDQYGHAGLASKGQCGVLASTRASQGCAQRHMPRTGAGGTDMEHTGGPYLYALLRPVGDHGDGAGSVGVRGSSPLSSSPASNGPTEGINTKTTLIRPAWSRVQPSRIRTARVITVDAGTYRTVPGDEPNAASVRR